MTSQEKKQYLSKYLYICDEIEDLLHDLEEWYTIAGKVTAIVAQKGLRVRWGLIHGAGEEHDG